MHLDRKVRSKGAAKLPWRKTVEIPADGEKHSWALDVKVTGDGSVNLVATVDGQVVSQTGGDGQGSGTGEVSVNGSVTS